MTIKMNNKIEDIIQHNNIILFDEICVLCNGWVKFLLKFDRHARFKLASVQSTLGQDILKYYAMPLDHYDTMLTIFEGQLFTESGAFLKVMQHLGFPFHLVIIGKIIPRFIRDFIYRQIASNRYRIFGKTDSCIFPSAENKKHFLED